MSNVEINAAVAQVLAGPACKPRLRARGSSRRREVADSHSALVIGRRSSPYFFPRPRKKIRPRDLAVPRPNLGVGVRHSLFPDRTRLGALAFAGGVLPDATLRGMRMFRSHGGTVLAVAGRDLLSEASLRPVRTPPAGSGAPDVVRTRLQFLLRVGTVTTGTAPAFGWPLALRYGSDLLALRLRSFCSVAACFFTLPH